MYNWTEHTNIFGKELYTQYQIFVIEKLYTRDSLPPYSKYLTPYHSAQLYREVLELSKTLPMDMALHEAFFLWGRVTVKLEYVINSLGITYSSYRKKADETRTDGNRLADILCKTYNIEYTEEVLNKCQDEKLYSEHVLRSFMTESFVRKIEKYFATDRDNLDVVLHWNLYLQGCYPDLEDC